MVLPQGNPADRQQALARLLAQLRMGDATAQGLAAEIEGFVQGGNTTLSPPAKSLLASALGSGGNSQVRITPGTTGNEIGPGSGVPGATLGLYGGDGGATVPEGGEAARLMERIRAAAAGQTNGSSVGIDAPQSASPYTPPPSGVRGPSLQPNDPSNPYLPGNQRTAAAEAYRPAGNPSGGGGNYSGAQAINLAEDDELLINYALRAAGFDPNRLTRFSKIAAKALVPLVKARRGAAALVGGAGAGNIGGLPEDIAGFAREFTSKGADFFGNAQRYAEGVQGSDRFQSAIAGLGDEEQKTAMYRSLMPLLYAGANPLVQQSAADTFQRRNENFNHLNSGFAVPGESIDTQMGAGVFMDWLRGRQNNDPLTRRIFGLGG